MLVSSSSTSSLVRLFLVIMSKFSVNSSICSSNYSLIDFFSFCHPIIAISTFAFLFDMQSSVIDFCFFFKGLLTPLLRFFNPVSGDDRRFFLSTSTSGEGEDSSIPSIQSSIDSYFKPISGMTSVGSLTIYCPYFIISQSSEAFILP